MELKLPLSNVQLELMKLFATNLSNEDLEDLEDLKDLLADKAIANANAVWDEKGLTDTYMEIWLNQKS